MARAEAQFGGTFGYKFRLRLDVDEVATDIPNNRSLVNVSLYMIPINSGTNTFNVFPAGNSNAPRGSIVVDGNQINFWFTYDFRGNANPKVLIQNYQQWIGHNFDGSRSVGVSGYADSKNAPFNTTAGTSLTLGLTTLPRYANITHFSVTNVRDVGFDINVSVDAVCDLLQYSIDGGQSWTQVPGDFTSKTISLSNLPSGRDYPVIVWVRRKVGGLPTQSGTITVSTPQQGKFLAFF